MTSSTKIMFAGFLFILLGFVWTCPDNLIADGPNEKIYLGTAKTEITPPIGTPLAGFGKRRGKPSSGVHDPLYSRAMILSRAGEDFILVSTDLVLIDEELRKEVLKKVRRQLAVRKENFVLFATHTHSGAGAIGSRFWEQFIMGKFRKKVFRKITDNIAFSVVEASRNKLPVTAEFSEARIDDLVENRMDERLNHPDWLRVFRFKNEEGVAAGFLIFMAAHPTMLPASNLEFSADFPGFLTREIEKESEGAALFVNGAAADLRPHNTGQFQNRFDSAEAYGKALAQRIRQMEFKPADFSGDWEGTIQRSRLPRTKIRAGFLRVPSFIGNRFFPRKTYFQTIRLGQYLLIPFPGELGSEIALEMESRFREYGLTPFVIGFANDYIAYVIPRRHYQNRRNYESQASFYGAKTDWFFQKKSDELVRSLLTADEMEAVNRPAERISQPNGIPVLKLSGDPYHQGFEEGRLMRAEIRDGIRDIFRYFRKELPIPLVNRVVINSISRRAWNKMEPYVSYNEFLEMKGIADGSGIPLRTIKKIHALPELFPTLCANSAFWGPATADGRLIAIRNLDWNKEMGIHQRAVVKFHGSASGPSYVNIGYAGFAGVLSGLNESGISVGQIGAASLDETMKGVPMPFLLKRVLREAQSLADVKIIFERSDLTRGYNYVFADAFRKEALVVEATQHRLAFFKDNDPGEQAAAYGLPFQCAVFRGDPALDPAIRELQIASGGNPKKPGLEMPVGSAYEIRYKKQGELIQKNFGKLTPEIAKEIAREIAPGSNIQSVIYAFPEFWVANRKEGKPAAQTEYERFNFEELEEVLNAF